MYAIPTKVISLKIHAATVSLPFPTLFAGMAFTSLCNPGMSWVSEHSRNPTLNRVIINGLCHTILGACDQANFLPTFPFRTCLVFARDNPRSVVSISISRTARSLPLDSEGVRCQNPQLREMQLMTPRVSLLPYGHSTYNSVFSLLSSPLVLVGWHSVGAPLIAGCR
jgi:hypothetical protein